MPEGPELFLSSVYINRICKDLIFSGKVLRNPIHKCQDITWNEPAYAISAESRGKELKIHLRCCSGAPKSSSSSDEERSLSILFTFGMSGKFEFAAADSMPKHSHLIFHTKKKPSMGLAFVDYRRFGKWVENGDWSIDRGPCVIQQHGDFMNNVAGNLDNSAFNKPICEVMLNQKFFNGIGNYLRAEILFRCSVAPFEKARSVLQTDKPTLEPKKESVEVKVEACETGMRNGEMHYCHDSKVVKGGGPGKGKRNNQKETKVKVETSEETDISDSISSKGHELLKLCGSIPLEVIKIGSTKYSLSELYKNDPDDGGPTFNDWLQCYYQEGMKNMADHNNRTIWFTGPAGPLVPKEQKIRGKKKSKSSVSEPEPAVKKESGNKMESSGNDSGKDEKRSSKALTRETLKDMKTKATGKTSKKAGRRENSGKSVSHNCKRKAKTPIDETVIHKKAKRNESTLTNLSTAPRRVTRSSIKIEP